MSVFLGLLLHAIGGLSAGSFYVPLKRVERWAWESSWFVMGVGAWILAPITVAAVTVPNLRAAIFSAPAHTLWWTYALGALWGVGGLTFGLAVRHLGMGLGYAVTLGFCAVFGTVLPPLLGGTFREAFFTASGGLVALGLLVCLGGIALSGAAGIRKERELAATGTAATTEYAPGKGYLIAFASGILSACMALALKTGQPIADNVVALAGPDAEAGTVALFRNNAVLCVVLLGGFTTNALWCLRLNLRRGTAGDYLRGGPGWLRNLLLSLSSGVIWYGQFFFYGAGSTRLGERYDFSSWTLHMAFIIVFSTLWSIALREWRGVSRATNRLLAAGVLVLILSTIIVGAGNLVAHLQDRG